MKNESMKRTRTPKPKAPRGSGVVVGIDVGQRFLAWCKLRYDADSCSDCEGTGFPTFEMLDWSIYDLGDAKDTKSVVENIVKFMRDRHILKEPEPTIIAIEQQFGHNNPRMTVISHVIQSGLLLSVSDASKCPSIFFQNASSKFYMFKGIGMKLPHETKGLDHATSYRLTKENSKWLASDILLPRIKHDAKFDDMYKSAQKKDDLADCLGIAVTHVLRHVCKVKAKKTATKTKKARKECTNEIEPLST